MRGYEASESENMKQGKALGDEHAVLEKEVVRDCLEKVESACRYNRIDFTLIKNYLIKFGTDYMRCEYQWPKR